VLVGNFDRVGSWSRDNALERMSATLAPAVVVRRDGLEHIFPIWASRQSLCVVRSSCAALAPAAAEARARQALIAAISGLTPTMFITRVRL